MFLFSFSISSILCPTVTISPVLDRTAVFWDVEDFPVLPGYAVEVLPEKIKRALLGEGYLTSPGDFSVQAYFKGLFPYQEGCHFWFTGINIEPMEKSKCSRLQRLLLDMVLFAFNNPVEVDNPYYEVNLMVIAKDCTEEDMGFFRHLKALQEKKFNVFLVVPDNCAPEQMPPPNTVSLVWPWKRLCDGKYANSDSDDSDSD